MSPPCCSWGPKRNDLVFPTSGNLQKEVANLVSMVPASIPPITSSSISDISSWKLSSKNMSIHTNSGELMLLIHLFCLVFEVISELIYTILLRHRRCCVHQTFEFPFACRIDLRVIRKYVAGSRLWFAFIASLFWFKHIIQHDSKTSQILITKIPHSAIWSILVFDLRERDSVSHYTDKGI